MSRDAGTRELLRYLPDHRVILCTTCAFCVLPNALARHLKDLHHLTKVQRQPYLDTASRLDIAEQDDVVYPERDSPPIPELQILDGLACNAKSCLHLCVTQKRMQAHWRVEHPSGTSDRDGSNRGMPVRLQTFFRGNNLRYFIVSDGAVTKQLVVASKAVLTGTAPTSDFFQAETDWLLLRHFHEETFHTLSLCSKQAQDAWRGRILQSCATHVFLRHAVLSITASHVASKSIDVRNVYAQHASSYLNTAMDRMSDAGGVTAENFFAILTFCRLMTVCCLAGLQRARTRLDNTSLTATSAMPKWVAIQRQGISFLWPHRRYISLDASQEPSPRLLDLTSMDQAIYASDAFDSHLKALLPLVTESQQPNDIASNAALQELRRLWAATSADRLSYRDGALLWSVRVPTAYWDAVQSDDPAALIVLAHFCVLWRMSEDDNWYARGHAQALLENVRARIDPALCGWLAWPMKSLTMG